MNFGKILEQILKVRLQAEYASQIDPLPCTDVRYLIWHLTEAARFAQRLSEYRVVEEEIGGKK